MKRKPAQAAVTLATSACTALTATAFPAGTLLRKREDRLAALMAENRREGLDIDSETGDSNGSGEAMDHDVAIHGLFEGDGEYGVPSGESFSAGQELPS